MDNLTNSCSTVSLEERNEILFVFGSVGLISTISCLFALLLAVWNQLYRRFVHRLAAYQVLSSLFFSLVCCSQVSFVGYDADSSAGYRNLCAAVGFLLEYSVWIKMSFMLWLVVHLFSFTVFYKSSEKYERRCVASLVLLPLVFVWIPFVHGMYGLAGAWCWIQNWNEDCASDKLLLGVIEQYVLLHAPLFLTLFIAIGLIIVMIIVLVKRLAYSYPASELLPLLRVDQRSRALKELVSLVAYPIFFFLLLIPVFSNRLYGDISNNVNFASFLSGGIAIPAIGFFSGMTLIVHVAILNRRKLSKDVVASCSINGDQHVSHVDIVNALPVVNVSEN